MILTIPEKKIIKTMKCVQKDLNTCVVFSNDFKNVYPCDDYFLDSVEKAFSSISKSSINLDATSAQYALQKLESIGYIKTFGSSPAYQLTYEGWYSEYITKVELFHAIINNIFVPIIVSVITTLFTIWIKSHA